MIQFISQEKLYQEIKDVIGNEDTTVTDEHLKDMSYLDMVFKEVIRLFPIGGMMQRTINEDITISKYNQAPKINLNVHFTSKKF